MPSTTVCMPLSVVVGVKAAPAEATTAADRKPILGERYKTTLCKSYGCRGECPYEWRCMFAHGAKELRTKQQNILAGLTTEEAIRSLQRELAEDARIAASSAAEADSSPTSTCAPSVCHDAKLSASRDSWAQPSDAAVSSVSTLQGRGEPAESTDSEVLSTEVVDDEEFALRGCVTHLGAVSLPERQFSLAASHDGGSLVMSALAEAANDDFVSPLAKAMIVGRKCESAVASPSKLVVSV